MNAPRREIPIIDLWTGKPWVAESESDAAPAYTADIADRMINANRARRSSLAAQGADPTGPPIAPHRFDDASALDLADAREERRCRCRQIRR